MSDTLAYKKKILLVDDDRSVSQMLCMLLETRGYEVITAYSAAEMMGKVSGSIDLIILDVLLPDHSGFDVCRILKENEDTQDIPLIILSSQLVSKDIVEGLYLGADDCLNKPFEYEELVARMEAIMRRYKKRPAEEHTHEMSIIGELARIIKEEDIVTYFQPIVDMSTYKIYGLEALCRPNTETILSNPEVLFKMAIKFGFYQELEKLSWRKAMQRASKFTMPVKLFLNCNPYFVEGEGFENIVDEMDELGMKPENIVLEITERSAITDYALFYEKLKVYRDKGLKFAVDDVGGGFASLESIVKTQPEVLKIDRHLVSELYDDEYKRSIIKFIIAFCKENGIFCIAEGIENKSDLNFLQTLGVDGGQGYYLCRPTPNVDLDKMQELIEAC